MTRAGLRDAIRIVTAALALSSGLSCDLFVSLGGLTNGQCPSGKKPCNGTCVSSSSTLYGCGSATDCSPCVLPNAADTICDRDNACAASLCVMPYKTCPFDLVHPGACATDTAHDANNCGDCSVHCQAIQNGIPGCAASVCAVGGCDKGFEDCNQIYSDGCETDLQHDPDNCGACAHACAPGQACVAGVCRSTDAAAD